MGMLCVLSMDTMTIKVRDLNSRLRFQNKIVTGVFYFCTPSLLPSTQFSCDPGIATSQLDRGKPKLV